MSHNESQTNVPMGWDYNPSSWPQRIPVNCLALLGAAIAFYLALYQWEVFDNVFEPFFGDGSRTVLHSSVSRALPIPDAALGGLSYIADAVAGTIGGRDRWRSMPWIVVIFGVAVGPLGAVSLALVALQIFVYQALCTLCLTSALISVVMMVFALDEVLASLQYLDRERKRRHSLWGAFWGTRHDTAEAPRA